MASLPSILFAGLLWLHAGAMAAPASAPASDPVLDPALERRAAALSQELRCVVCQNQTIADSQAELAVDLRRQVRARLAEGLSDEQVLDYVVARYGDFVLYRPPLRASTIVLWFGPVLLLGGGMLALLLRLRARRRLPAAAVDADAGAALARAAALLEQRP